MVCGDQVEVRRDGDAGVIEAVLPRASLLYRSDAFKSKAIAANVTQLAVVVAARPSFSMELVQRCVLAAEDQGIASLLILNKADLPETPGRTRTPESAHPHRLSARHAVGADRRGAAAPCPARPHHAA